MQKRKEIWRLTLILLLASGFFACKKHSDHPTPSPPATVKILRVDSAMTNASREYSGTVAASESTTVSFAVGGTITNLYAQEGDKVTKGKLLARVKSGDYENAYNIAQAQLAEAQDGYERLKKLHDANALPDVKWVEIQQKLKQAENAAEMAKRTLNDASLFSPVSGTVTRKFVDEGQTVVPVEPVYEIVSMADLTVDISVSENEVGKFEIGEKAFVRLDALGEETIEGKVKSKSVTSDPLTRSYTIKISIPNKDGRILPGMLGNVHFNKTGGEENSGIILPSRAVQLNDDNRWFVWVVKDSVAMRKFVTADELVSNGILVTSGLEPGDNVIVEGMQKVGSGSRVRY